MRNPVISAPEMSDEDLYNWMEQKLSAMRRLRELQFLKAELNERLAGIENQIEEATAQSRIDVWREGLCIPAALIENSGITANSIQKAVISSVIQTHQEARPELDQSVQQAR
ncbi:TPA: hypothetical protein ACH2JI_004724 [Enterobacter roggenkampii]|jgi:DNA-binding transcriptional regulator YbjK